MLELTGSGFDDSSEVYLGSSECVIQERNSSWIMCITPAGSDGEVNTYVSVSGTTAQSATNFTYDEANSPEVTSFSPDTISVQGVLSMGVITPTALSSQLFIHKV